MPLLSTSFSVVFSEPLSRPCLPFWAQSPSGRCSLLHLQPLAGAVLPTQSMASASEEPLVTFTIKNPSKQEADAFRLCVPLSATLADIQRRIAAEYDGNPSPQLQTVREGAQGLARLGVVETPLKLLLYLFLQLIYAGKVLKDPTLMVQDIVQQVRPPAGAGVCAHWLNMP